jgi:DNA-binding transcriptional MerR regulator
MDRVTHDLPPIPAKRYFTIGEVSELCLVKPYVLRYWEQEFVQLKPMKRRGNRRYYQHHEVLLIRRIRELLYEQGFTISGARNRLSELGHAARVELPVEDFPDEATMPQALAHMGASKSGAPAWQAAHGVSRALQASPPAVAERAAWFSPDEVDFSGLSPEAVASLRASLLSIRDLLS